jgi:hypothetical protein
MTVNMRQTHPNLYKAYTSYALISAALGLNFLFLHPTFDPLGIPKDVMGVIFLALGGSKLLLLNVAHNTTAIRGVMALGIAVMLFWASALTIEFFLRSQTSLQLPITFFGLALLGIPIILEPPANPLTNTNGPISE